MAFMLEKLEVSRKAVDFAGEAASLTESFPRGCGFLADQLNRAALSIAADLSEANGRLTKADRTNPLTIALSSAQECVPILELANRRRPVGEARHLQRRGQLETMAKMTGGLVGSLHRSSA